MSAYYERSQNASNFFGVNSAADTVLDSNASGEGLNDFLPLLHFRIPCRYGISWPNEAQF